MLIAMFKTVITLLVAFVTWPVEAENYRMITVEKLPQAARELLVNHFPHQEVSYAAAERSLFERSYKVYLADGSTIEFDRNGTWYEIDCHGGVVPPVLIPKPIREQVALRFPAMEVEQIERLKKGYKVELREGPELKFDARYRLVYIDD